MKRIAGIGNALTDMLVNMPDDSILEKYSLAKGSMNLVDGELQTAVSKAVAGSPYTLSLGGSAGNTIRTLASLGYDTGFIGEVGHDTTGDFFEQALRNLDIEPHIFRGTERSGKCVSLISPDGERTMLTHLGAALEMRPEMIDRRLFAGFDSLYIEGYLVQDHALIRRIASEADAAGLDVAIDLASFNVVEENRNLLRDVVDKRGTEGRHHGCGRLLRRRLPRRTVRRSVAAPVRHARRHRRRQSNRDRRYHPRQGGVERYADVVRARPYRQIPLLSDHGGGQEAQVLR